MQIIEPAWAKGLQVSAAPLWTVESRHEFMVRALLSRRLAQGSPSSPIDYYRGVLSRFCADLTSFAAIDRWDLKEIISDDLDTPQPYWYGLWVRNQVHPLSPGEHEQYITSVNERRRSLLHGTIPYPTHFKIGELLFEPILFFICGSGTRRTVSYYAEGTWWEVDGDTRPLPVIVTAEDMSEVAGAVDDDERRGRVALIKTSKIKDSLWQISEKVLWPALLDADAADTRFSLVFIHASVWQTPGVWALHGMIRASARVDADGVDLPLIRSLIDPPICCIQDATGALLLRDATKKERIRDVQLLLRCGRILASHDDIAKRQMRPEETQLYHRPQSKDPVKRFGLIFRTALRVKLGDAVGTRDLLLEDYVLTACEHAFAGWHLEDCDVIARLLVENALRMCARLITPTKDSLSEAQLEVFNWLRLVTGSDGEQHMCIYTTRKQVLAVLAVAVLCLREGTKDSSDTIDLLRCAALDILLAACQGSDPDGTEFDLPDHNDLADLPIMLMQHFANSNDN